MSDAACDPVNSLTEKASTMTVRSTFPRPKGCDEARRAALHTAVQLTRDARGVAYVEYLILLALVVFAAMIGFQAIGNATNESANGAAESIRQLNPQGGGE